MVDANTDDWLDWYALEAAIPLDVLPSFHRAFLTLNNPREAWDDAPLRRVQGKVQAALKRLEREGRARPEGERLLVAPQALPEGFEEHFQRDHDGV